MTGLPNNIDALLMVGTSEKLADLYYATRFRAPDEFVFIWIQSEKILLVSNLEVDRAREEADVDRVIPYSDYEKNACFSTDNPSQKDIIIAVLSELKIEKIHVPNKFPIGIGDTLRANGWDLRAFHDPLFPEREIKNKNEIEYIRDSQSLQRLEWLQL